jgi:tRNA/tmRNA/rRNA uracil-C5-methylase (TrmA/RlmC/RlmD family)
MNSIIDTISTFKFKESKAYAKSYGIRGYSKYTSKATLSAFIISNGTEITEITDALGATVITEKLSHINVLDLFSGYGGMTYGFEKRFNVVCGIDVWDKAIESYNANYEHLGICRDLTSYPPE